MPHLLLLSLLSVQAEKGGQGNHTDDHVFTKAKPSICMQYGPLKPKDALKSLPRFLPKALATDEAKKPPVWPKSSPCPDYTIVHFFLLYIVFRHGMK